ncbi:hypothetical protein JAAARDRAFT_28281 [Jaapia argillacea MUCL 33604]|uniref:Folylpolyglutamate synthase n=1 Tax=Jaapia argillacea MUCL 33604 TaxID=933084 RepID=A0A067QM90_9AGAM|nr:hypothetical protein JAAARDRAFT_28281 [Jaapia argillacea MUCL 33604]
MSTRTYKDAIELLNGLQSNAAILEALRASGGRMSEFAIPEMVEYLGRIGYSPEDLNKMNVIHVTGTKGKGSTCAFTSSILRSAMPHWNVGLYTSPHIVAVRERVRVNGAPLSEEDFAKYFFEVWDRLDQNDVRQHPSTSAKPMYFRYVTLVAYHAFLSLKLDAVILEVGVGGRYDSTNIVPKPVVAGVTALGLDHTNVLGKTIAEIAWQKGGIYKEGVPALTVNQPQEGMDVLRREAANLKASEFVVTSLIPGLSDVKLGLSGEHQVQNATLAVYLARTFLEARSVPVKSDLPKAFVEGLEKARWPGRCQTVADPRHTATTWYLDGAHTVESLDCCVQWFVNPGVGLPADPSSKPTTRVLIFNCTHGRSGPAFLGGILAKIAAQLKLHGREDEKVETFFDTVIFCANVTYADGGFKSDLTAIAIPDGDLAQLKTQTELASAWRSLVPSFPTPNIHVLPSIEHAVKVVRQLESNAQDLPVAALVTGSLHLVGGVIEVAGLSDVAL